MVWGKWEILEETPGHPKAKHGFLPRCHAKVELKPTADGTKEL